MRRECLRHPDACRVEGIANVQSVGHTGPTLGIAYSNTYRQGNGDVDPNENLDPDSLADAYCHQHPDADTESDSHLDVYQHADEHTDEHGDVYEYADQQLNVNNDANRHTDGNADPDRNRN